MASINYKDPSTGEVKRIPLYAGSHAKQLWNGTWTEGTISVPDIWDYALIAVYVDTTQGWAPVLCARMDSYLFHGFGAWHAYEASAGLYQQHFTLELGGSAPDNLSYNYITGANLGGTGNGAVNDWKRTITAVYGLCKNN